MSVIYKSNLSAFLNKYSRNKEANFKAMGDLGLININNETPVLSGELKENNNYRVENSRLSFFNKLYYAIYVELGTFVMYSNPFMRRGIAKSTKSFISILVRGFRV